MEKKCLRILPKRQRNFAKLRVSRFDSISTLESDHGSYTEAEVSRGIVDSSNVTALNAIQLDSQMNGFILVRNLNSTR